LNGFYKTSINEKWSIRTGSSYSFLKNDVAIDTIQVEEKYGGIHAKAVADGSISDKIELRVGGELISTWYDAAVDTSAITLGFDETIASLFVESDVYTSNKFVTRIGARSEFNSLTERFSIDPRLSLAYKMGKGQVALAYGKFRQSPKNEWLRLDNNLKAETADHYILNYQLIENKKTFRVEVYYKNYDNLVKFENGELTNNGNGFARGAELFWRDNQSIRNADYWISYSYLDTKRDYLNTPYSVTPTFASTHNFSVVYKHFIKDIKSQIGMTYSFTSGRPYNDPNEEEFNNGRTKSYQDLSMNISYLPKPSLIIFLSCTNLLGRDNIFGYEYSNKINNEGLYARRAIRQPARRFLFVGIFITISKNKSVNQLPSL
jgi:hypothetical protein